MDNCKKQQNKRNTRQTSSESGSSNDNKTTPKSKKIKPDPDATIDMSQQLLMKKKKPRKRKSNQPLRTLPNGKTMPSLADLEKMFEDTDTDEQILPHSVSKVPKTPMKHSTTATGDMVLSPNTIKNISDHMMDMITKVNPTLLSTQLELPKNIITTHKEVVPIVQPKEKFDNAYIEGCKHSDQVLAKGSLYFCKDDAESDVTELSKSMFNAQSNELFKNDIAKILTEIENSDKSSDSNKTEDYNYTANMAKNDLIITSSPLSLMNNDSDKTLKIFERNTTNKDTLTDTKVIKVDKDTHSCDSDDSNKTVDYEPSVDLIGNNSEVLFSPLPSTSRDSKTFIENDLLYNKSLSLTSNSTFADAPTEEEDDDVQIIEPQSETTIIKEETDHNSIRETGIEDSVEIIEPINSKSIIKLPNKVNDDDCIVLIDDNYNKSNNNDDIPTYVIDDEYANVEIDKELSINTDEIIDIDELIEENKTILGKLSETKRSSSVIEVIEIPNSQSPNIENTKANIISILDDNSDNHRNLNKKSKSNGANVPSSSSSLGTFHIIQKIVTDYFNNTFNTLHLPRLHKKHKPQHKYNRVSNKNNFNRSVEEIPYNLQFPNIEFNNPTQHNHAEKSSMKSKTSETQNLSENSPVARNTENKNSKNIGDCPICMESLNANTIASTICGHVFCFSCIQVSIKSNGKRCPTCRKTLKGIGYHQLYL